jgi:SAM-dependent methyltransferase
VSAAGALGADAVRPCPGCGRAGEGRVFSEERFDLQALDEFAFASRKLPEFFSHRLVVCPHCELVYAPRVPDAAVLERTYREAAFDSAEEGACAARTYAAALAPLLTEVERGAALEIGCGTGVFLGHLQALGFAPVTGLEPSRAARDAAPAELRALIRPVAFAGADFASDSLALACCFQTLEHLAAPDRFVAEIRRALAPRGVLCTVTHDRSAFLNRLLGRRSPIIDIEHVQLFSRASLARMLEGAGFEVLAMRSLVNRYPLRYWLRLSPLPRRPKLLLLRVVERIGLGGWSFGLDGGNFVTVARKRVPAEQARA